MSIFIDTLAETITNSITDADATRQDWERALQLAFAAETPAAAPFPPVIGLTGLARSGKDTVGALLTERHGFTRVAFADGVREAALALDPLIWDKSGEKIIRSTIEQPDLKQTLQMLLHRERPGQTEIATTFDNTPRRLSEVVNNDGWDEAKAVPEVRRTLQRIGTEAGWMIHGQNLWVDLAANKITGPTVITDMRFAQEVTWLDSIGGTLWRIERPGNELALTGEVAGHASEAGDLGREPDAIIVNDGTIEDLAARVDELLTAPAN